MRSVRVLPLVLVLLAVSFPSFAQTARSPEFRVNAETEGHQMLPEVAMNALGEFVVVWSSRERESEAGEHSLHARRFAADGTPETGDILVRENVGDYVETAAAMMEDGSFVVVYAGHLEDVGAGQIISSIFEGRRFAADGAPLGAPFTIGTGRIPQNPSVAARPEGGFIVAWEAHRQEVPGVFVRLFDGDGSPVRNEILVAQGNDPALDVGPEGEIVVVWIATEPGGGRRRYGVALQRISPSGALLGRRSRVSNNSPQFLHSIRVAKDATGGFTVVWAGDFGGVYDGTLARRYFPNGLPATRIERLDSSGFDTEIAPDRNGDFVLVWAGGGGPDDGLEVLGRKYRSHLHRTRRVFRVNTTRPGHQRDPDVADDGAGNFVVVWQGEGQDGSGPDDIFARLYSRK